jgi:outer membrane receptor protein involved in Fe transport
MKFISVLLILILCLVSSNVFSQEVRLHAIVIDAITKEPLTGANVYLAKTSIGAVTDEDGYFLLTAKNISEEDSLVVSFMGYQTYRISLSSFKNQKTIELKPTSLKYGDEILVRAERENLLKQDIPQSGVKINYKEIEQYGSNEISDILKPAPAIHIEGNDLDGRKINIRGGNSDEVNVYLDGVLINNLRFDNSADLSIIPVENIEEMEIVKSGNSTLLGNGAFAGVVNISSRKPDRTGATIKAKVGSFQSRILLANANIFLSKKLNLSYFGQLHKFSPEIDYYQDERVEPKTRNPDILTNRQNHMGTLNYFTSGGQFTGRFISYLFDYEKPDFQVTYQNYLTILGYHGSLWGSPDFSITANHFYSENHLEQTIPQQTVEFNDRFITNRLNFRAAKRFEYNLTEIQLLAEYLHDDLKNTARVKYALIEDQRVDESFYDNRISFASVFSFKDKLDKWPQLSWKTYIGIRGDAVASGHSDVSPAVGAKIEYRNHPWEITPYMNYGKNVKYPTLLENAYIRNISNISLTDTLSERLKPEYNNSTEFGINFRYILADPVLNNIEFSYELFSRITYNKVISRPFDFQTIYIQIGRNIMRGYEMSVGLNELFKKFHLNASWFELNISEPFFYAYKPESRKSLHLRYNSDFGLYLNTTAFHEGKSVGWYLDSDDNVIIQDISPFSDMDLVVGFLIPLKSVTTEIQFAGYNIFDNSGYTYYYLRKRFLQFLLALKY